MAPTNIAGAVVEKPKTQSVKPPGRPRVERIVVQAEPSTPVLWYKKADPGETPVPAIATAKVGADRNHLWVFDADGTHQFPRRNVPHMSDPILTTRKHSQGGQPIGAWDFNPDFVPERYRNLNAMHVRIVLLHQLHAYTAFQVAQAIGWQENVVQAVLDKHAESREPGTAEKSNQKAAK